MRWLRPLGGLSEYRVTRQLSCRPDSVSISENDEKPVASHQRHAIDLADVMSRVEASGGPRMGSPCFHGTFTMTATSNKLLWDTHNLRQECERRTKATAALAALANYVHSYSALFVHNGPQMLTRAARIKGASGSRRWPTG